MPFKELYLSDELRKEIDNLKNNSFMKWLYYQNKLIEYEKFCHDNDEILTFGEFANMY